MELTGTIKLINKTELIGEKGFKKRSFVIVTNEQYPQAIILECTQDKVALLDKYKAGDAITASVNIQGREWINPQGEAKYFVTIQAWRIKYAESEDHAINQQPNVAKSQPQIQEVDDSEDLPF